MRAKLFFAISGLLTLPAAAAELQVEVEIPKLNVAEYHRPYVAIWLEGADQKVAANLAVWYMQKDTAEGHGTKWLPDLRQWWRRSGRNLDLPVDGVTGPTRPAGRHVLKFDERHPQLGTLPPEQRKRVARGELWVGNPARPVRTLSAKDIEGLRYAADHYVRLKDQYLGMAG